MYINDNGDKNPYNLSKDERRQIHQDINKMLGDHYKTDNSGDCALPIILLLTGIFYIVMFILYLMY